MFLKKILEAIFKTDSVQPKVEVVQTCDVDICLRCHEDNSLSHELRSEIDFSHRSDLEKYVRTLNVPRQAIESWVSAGLLFPEEMIVAEKMIKIMRKIEHEQSD
ncbi:MAG: hypothetical protein GY874_02035 [Desulfobacteraceae bacterium]|nr:hypothetical protein [Desulfobacteraceae bacterium]